MLFNSKLIMMSVMFFLKPVIFIKILFQSVHFFKKLLNYLTIHS